MGRRWLVCKNRDNAWESGIGSRSVAGSLISAIRTAGQMTMAIGYEDRPVDDRKHEAVCLDHTVEQREVETSARVAWLVGRLHQAKKAGFPGAIFGVDMGPVQMSDRPGEGQQMVYQNQRPGDCRELENDTPVRMFILALVDLVVQQEGVHRDDIGEDHATQVDQHVLVEPSPRRVTDAEEDGLRENCQYEMSINLIKKCQSWEG